MMLSHIRPHMVVWRKAVMFSGSWPSVGQRCLGEVAGDVIAVVRGAVGSGFAA